MSSSSQKTYLPDDPDDVAAVYDFLAEHARRGGETPPRRYRLVGGALGDEVEIPEHVYLILHDVIAAMRRNLAITIVPQTMTLTTQQAADLLGVSRPTVVKYLESGHIPFDKVGSHRRLLLADVIEFRDRRRRDQRALLDDLDLGEDVTPEEAVAVAAQARRQLAEEQVT